MRIPWLDRLVMCDPEEPITWFSEDTIVPRFFGMTKTESFI
jgi:hypothetical protein